MSVLINVDGACLYDSTLLASDGYILHKATISSGLNKGGKATFIVPRENPRYNDFVALKSLVEVYRNGDLRWRGRALVPGRDLYGRKTIVCEGELCFLQDSVQRLRTITGTPTAVFSEIISAHNSAVDPWKRFAVGTVSVTVDGDELSVDITAGQKTHAIVERMVADYGGYIIFDSLPDGSRRINWFSEPPYSCNQQIRLGYNLLDFSSSGNVNQYANRIIPYGAENEDGTRVQIDIGGKDYVEDAEAVASRGAVEACVVYDGVTDPEELRTLAEQDLALACAIPEKLRLSALDMSLMDLSLDAFQIGQSVTAVSDYHDMSGQYHLIALSEDLLDPREGAVELSRDAKYTDGVSGTLTGSIAQKDQANKQQFASYVTMVGVITQRILGARGGAVRLLDTDGDDLPDTLYVADNPDTEKAEKVWRLNYEGWGASKTGFNGPFVMGATLEDGILASAITAATLVAGTIQSSDRESFLLDLDNNTITASSLSLIISGKSFAEYEENRTSEMNILSDRIESEVAAQAQRGDDLEERLTRVEQNSDSWSVRVEKLETDGVHKVSSGNGVVVDENGLNVYKDGEETSTTIDFDGLDVTRTSDGEAVLTATAEGVNALNVTARKYLTIGKHSRIEDYSNGSDTKRTAIFWIDGEGE